MRTGFIGGAMPLYMRLPKRGFSNAPFRNDRCVVARSRIEAAFGPSEEVTMEALRAKGILSGRKAALPVKELADGGLGKPLVFVGPYGFSKAAREAVEKAGGRIVAAGDAS